MFTDMNRAYLVFSFQGLEMFHFKELFEMFSLFFWTRFKAVSVFLINSERWSLISCPARRDVCITQPNGYYLLFKPSELIAEGQGWGQGAGITTVQSSFLVNGQGRTHMGLFLPTSFECHTISNTATMARLGSHLGCPFLNNPTKSAHLQQSPRPEEFSSYLPILPEKYLHPPPVTLHLMTVWC